MKILIVDDDKIALSLLEKTLSMDGHKIVTASNGREALEILGRDHIQMVVTDWYMPEMSGIELCKEIRTQALKGYTYIILLTTHDQKQEILTGLSSGIDDYITKPFNPAELNLRVEIGERILSLETRDMTIFALAKLAESRDTDTGLHLERIRNYSKIIATGLSSMEKYKGVVTAEYIRNIYIASPLHDIGKVSVPDSVLLKPGRLNEAEWVIMKKHAGEGAETLRTVMEHFPQAVFLKIALDITWCHHEKYDGSGYPRGLKGEEIPLAGRIVALADVYDALTSKRVYKKAFTTRAAHTCIVEASGRHFDPDVVNVFLANETSFIKTFNDCQQRECRLNS
jgi:putative two-component system response regulator